MLCESQMLSTKGLEMPKSALCCAFLIAVVCLAVSSLPAAERPADFGKRWVRSNPFAMMGLTILDKAISPPKTPFDLAQYQGQNYTFLLAWKQRSGLFQDASRTGYPWFIHLYDLDGPTDAFKKRVRKLFAEYPGNVGLLINDEPSRHGVYRKPGKPVNDFAGAGRVLAWLRENYPAKLILSNIGGTGGLPKHYYGRLKDPTPEQIAESKKYGYSEYVHDFMAIVKPDILMFDAYIFKYGDGNESGVTQCWYQSLWGIRHAGLKAGVPYWAWMQTWDRPSPRGYNVRLPSESDYRMNVFCVLTYGFKGIADFMYCGAHKRDILMPDGTPSPLYAPAAKVHAEVRRVGRSLRFLTSTHVAFLPGSKESRCAAFLKNWARGAGGDRKIRSLRILNGSKHRTGVIGHFRDDTGQVYFMLTNLYQHAHKSAAETAVRFHITFDPKVRTILRLSRETGKVERLTIDDPADGLTLTLPGGTGDLFKYDTGPFAGLK